MSSDSSGSDEETIRLKEAVDPSLLKNDLYKNGIIEEKNDEKPSKSLRNQNHEVVANNPFSLKVTPEFQKHVSQHLSKLLDKTIDDTEEFLKLKKWRKKSTNGGVRLLLASKQFLNSDTVEIYDNPRKNTRKTVEKEIDYEARAREAAVSPKWILNKEEVKFWAPSWKNNVEFVKIDNCKSKKKKKKTRELTCKFPVTKNDDDV